MGQIAYTVIAETDDESAATAFEAWLVGGHIADVVAAGAESGQLVAIDREASDSHRFEVRYIFGSRKSFLRYEQGPAIALRDEGVALFGPESEHPVRFTRTVGTVAAYSTGA